MTDWSWAVAEGPPGLLGTVKRSPTELVADAGPRPLALIAENIIQNPLTGSKKRVSVFNLGGVRVCYEDGPASQLALISYFDLVSGDRGAPVRIRYIPFHYDHSRISVVIIVSIGILDRPRRTWCAKAIPEDGFTRTAVTITSRYSVVVARARVNAIVPIRRRGRAKCRQN